MNLDLPAGLVVRPITRDDVEAVTQLIRACEVDLDGVAQVDSEDVAMGFGRPGFDPEQDCILVLDDEKLIAWADVYGERAEADTHPSYRGRGIGPKLLAWTEQRARQLGAKQLRQVVTDANVAAATMFKSAGYETAYTSWILEIGFERPPERPNVPDGISMRLYEPGEDDQAVHRLIDDAFNEWEGRTSSPFEEWAALLIHHGSFAPELSPLAFDGDELVGAALALDYRSNDDGWIQQLATRATHRHRGIARALLLTSFKAFYDKGKKRSGLSTDTRSGALALYERVGMRVTRSYTNYVKQL